jgi:negative regulator of genetic competence, sporulation and motility
LFYAQSQIVGFGWCKRWKVIVREEDVCEEWTRMSDVWRKIEEEIRHQLKQNYEAEAVRLLAEILDNAKEIEGKAEEVKEFDDNLHYFLEFRAMKISDNITRLRKLLGLKPLSEYNLEEGESC